MPNSAKQPMLTAAPYKQWRFWLALSRSFIALLCLTTSLLLPQSSFAISALWAIYFVYASAAIFYRSLEQLGFPQLGLLVDMVFFILCASIPNEYSLGLTSVFYLYVLLAAALEHTSREVIIVVAISVMFLILVKPTQSVTLSPAVLLTGAAVIIVSLQKKLLQDRVKAAAMQTQMYRSEAEHAREAERQRIAADFHDGPLQSFVAIQMRLEVMRKMLERDPRMAAEELKQLQELTKTQAMELRSFIRGMRPVEIDGAGLTPSIKKLVDSFEKESGISSTLVGSQIDSTPEPDTAREILQIVREALHNVQKHSKASRVTVAVDKENGFFELSVEDDGTGFAFAGIYTLEELELLRLGPVSIRRRVRGLNGEMLLDSQPGRGSSVRIRIPV